MKLLICINVRWRPRAIWKSAIVDTTANSALMGLRNMSVQNSEIVAMFDQAAELFEIQAENQFRVRAYRHVARVI
jgi:hypothetical protein